MQSTSENLHCLIELLEFKILKKSKNILGNQHRHARTAVINKTLFPP